jgi:hypothetical protein
VSRFVVTGAIAVAVLGVACASREAPRAMAPAASPEPPPPPSLVATDAFETEVRPILARRCTPCHVPGGKMYERMPFDDVETVRGHREGILRRLQGDDRASVERWFGGS